MKTTRAIALTIALAPLTAALFGSLGCSSAPADDSNASEDALRSATWCNSGHTADAEEGDFNGFGGRSCTDAASKTQCAHLGGTWCRGYVDDQVLLCACKEKAKPVAFCPQGALATGHLQAGAAGGPDAKASVSCDATHTLCRIDPQGSDNDVCSDANDCYACTK